MTTGQVPNRLMDLVSRRYRGTGLNITTLGSDRSGQTSNVQSDYMRPETRNETRELYIGVVEREKRTRKDT